MNLLDRHICVTISEEKKNLKTSSGLKLQDCNSAKTVSLHSSEAETRWRTSRDKFLQTANLCDCCRATTWQDCLNLLRVTAVTNKPNTAPCQADARSDEKHLLYKPVDRI